MQPNTVAQIIETFRNRRDLRGHVVNVNLPAKRRGQWKPTYHCPHGLGGFDEQYQLERNGEQLSWQLTGEFHPTEGLPMDDSAALCGGSPDDQPPTTQLNHPQGLSARIQQRLSDAIGHQLLNPETE